MADGSVTVDSAAWESGTDKVAGLILLYAPERVSNNLSGMNSLIEGNTLLPGKR